MTQTPNTPPTHAHAHTHKQQSACTLILWDAVIYCGYNSQSDIKNSAIHFSSVSISSVHFRSIQFKIVPFSPVSFCSGLFSSV